MTITLVLGSPVPVGAAEAGPGTSAAEDLRARARQMMEDGRYGEARPILDELIRIAPGDGDAYVLRGLSRWRALTAPGDGFAEIQGQLCLKTPETCADANSARADLAHAVALLTGPAKAQALADRAAIDAQEGALAQALADYDDALRLVPDDAGYRERRAAIRRQTGDPRGAVADLDAALAVRPGDGELLVRRAELRREVGDPGGARADLDAAIHDQPSTARSPWFETALALRRAVARPDEPGMQPELRDLTVSKATTGHAADGRPNVLVTFDPSSAARLAAYTAARVGSRVQLLIDGKVVMEPLILSPITGGIIEATGPNPLGGDAESLAERLRVPGASIMLRAVD